MNRRAIEREIAVTDLAIGIYRQRKAKRRLTSAETARLTEYEDHRRALERRQERDERASRGGETLQ